MIGSHPEYCCGSLAILKQGVFRSQRIFTFFLLVSPLARYGSQHAPNRPVPQANFKSPWNYKDQDNSKSRKTGARTVWCDMGWTSCQGVYQCLGQTLQVRRQLKVVIAGPLARVDSKARETVWVVKETPRVSRKWKDPDNSKLHTNGALVYGLCGALWIHILEGPTRSPSKLQDCNTPRT